VRAVIAVRLSNSFRSGPPIEAIAMPWLAPPPVQIEELLEHCEALSATGSVLLVGDFNATPDSDEVCT
jgi:hypothetical protein